MTLRIGNLDIRYLEFIKDLLIVIDKKDKVLGYKPKKACHEKPGILHRAFSIFIFNKKRELLIQKRSKFKNLWPGIWSNSCCSHPKKREIISRAAEQRLKEELGFSCPLRFMGKVKYQACWEDKGCEKEITYIFSGNYDGLVKSNDREIMEVKWIDLAELKKEIKKYPNNYTPWLKKIINQFSFH